MSRRRTRYAIHMIDGSIHTGLAYSPEFYSKRDDVARVEPYKAYLARRANAGGGWSIDADAVAEAVAFFGLTLPIKFELSARTSTTLGQHMLTPVGGGVRVSAGKIYNLDTATGWEHRVMLRSWLSPEDASRTLWHELTHAMQAERALSKVHASATIREQYHAWRFSWDRAHGRTAYTDKPVEREARAHEAYAEALPLVK